jgi:hypothetical protein
MSSPCCLIESLRKYFSIYGSIEDSVVMKDPATKRSRGFGFITFNNTIAVDNAVKDDPHTIDARRVSLHNYLPIPGLIFSLAFQVEVKRAVPKAEIGSTSQSPAGTPSKAASSVKATATISPALTPLKKPSNQLATIAVIAGTSPAKLSTSVTAAAVSPSSLTTPTKGIRSNSVTSTISNSTDDNRYNTEEYANNKIFVGGLHYDTRDG